MQRIRMNLGKRIDDSYDILIDSNMLEKIASGLLRLKIGKIAIITDSNIKKIYGHKFLSMLKEKGLDAILVSFPAGENNKTRETKIKIEDYLLDAGLGRDGVIIALGGGVTGDLAGFIASTFMRGISYLQIPTSLLAMIDSSIGGKTAVDTPKGKNIIGTFYQPKKVFVDVYMLKTLPKEELINGLAEMIKHAVILDDKYFVFLNDYIDRIFSLEESVVSKAIKWSLKIKKAVVERDEKETAIRKILNFGHTIGHAVETSSNYKMKHGQAVAAGMIVETKIAEKLGIINPIESRRIFDLINKAGFQFDLKIDKEKIINCMKHDKKSKKGVAKFVLPRKAGKAEIDFEVDEQVIRDALEMIK